MERNREIFAVSVGGNAHSEITERRDANAPGAMQPQWKGSALDERRLEVKTAQVFHGVHWSRALADNLPMAVRPRDLESFVEDLLEGLQIIGPDWRYLYLNKAAARHGRSSREALIGRTMMDCYPGIEKTAVFARMRQCMEQRIPAILENAFTYPDGATGYFELRLEPVPQGLCVLSIDITARKDAELATAQAEERLRHAQRMEAIGQLTAAIAHDFNNLLTAILGQGELALERPEGPTRADIETMLEAARSSAQLTRQLLAHGRHTVLQREPLDLAEVLRGVERILRAAIDSRIQLSIDAPQGVGRVQVDRSQIEQIVMNLVVNARDAIAGPGRIAVSLAATDFDDEVGQRYPGAQPGPHVALVVSDTGAGMDAATRARIFEPFFTTKERGRGTGLGLSTVYGIVKQHSGHIWVYSEPGKGTTFKVYFPLASGSATEVSANPPRSAPRAARRQTVLVAEDDPILGKLICAVLAAEGYRPALAAEGAEAIRLWEEHEASIALLVTDMTMPGLTGPELIERVRARRPDLPVICTSGYSDSELNRRGTLPVGVTFVEKPFSPKVLRQRVLDLLSQN
jgi:signal transduction histidine kinase